MRHSSFGPAHEPVTEKDLSLAAEQRQPNPEGAATLARRSLASNGGAVAVGHDATANTDRWCLLVAEARAMPGFMTLRAVRESGQVVNFVWDFASAAAGRLLCCRPSRMFGRPLLDVLGEALGPASVLDQYRQVVEYAAAVADDHFHVISGVEDLFRHRAVRLGDGVAVTLTNLSALGRANRLRHAMVRKGTPRW